LKPTQCRRQPGVRGVGGGRRRWDRNVSNTGQQGQEGSDRKAVVGTEGHDERIFGLSTGVLWLEGNSRNLNL